MEARQLFCTDCHWYGDRPKETTPGLLAFELVFWGLFLLVGYVVNPFDGFNFSEKITLISFILPPLFYSGWRLSSVYLACPVCGHDRLIPSGSPRARAMIDRCNKEMVSLEKEERG